MSIDFTLPPEVEEVRLRVRKFMEEEVRPAQEGLQRDGAERGGFVQAIVKLRQRALPPAGHSLSRLVDLPRTTARLT